MKKPFSRDDFVAQYYRMRRSPKAGHPQLVILLTQRNPDPPPNQSGYYLHCGKDEMPIDDGEDAQQLIAMAVGEFFKETRR